MPIRFRCPACGQLMGIARRKAGSTVACTNCSQPVRVPNGDEATQGTPAPPTGPVESSSNVFDRDDFSQFLQPPAVVPPFSVSPKADEDQPLSVAVGPTRKQPPGLLLSPTQATVLTVTLIVLLATAFLSGLLVGRFAL